MFRTLTVGILASLACMPVASASAARSVSLSDARVAPTRIYVIPAHSARTILAHRQCPRHPRASWMETSAYRGTGSALPAQAWNASHTVTRWGMRVTFDGITVRNRTDAPIIFAGWC
jgi:hypothetical protein